MLDEDWDPDSHEQLMKQQFGDEYYAAEEQGDFNGFEDEGEDYYEGMEGNGDQEEEGDEAVT